jgi:hypothetical protein
VLELGRVVCYFSFYLSFDGGRESSLVFMWGLIRGEGERKRNGGGMDTRAAHLSCSWRLELLREVLFMTEEEGESYIFAVLLSLVVSPF